MSSVATAAELERLERLCGLLRARLSEATGVKPGAENAGSAGRLLSDGPPAAQNSNAAAHPRAPAPARRRQCARAGR